MNNTIIDVLLMLYLCDYRYSITLYYSIKSSGIKQVWFDRWIFEYFADFSMPTLLDICSLIWSLIESLSSSEIKRFN